ncbi:hypothetical protein pdam_00006842 [Pocillopora damicornis]|uniref:Uncharacterized protein n=1 Tax=Pocillopora damicornis TaxID=46731 RepID=A0A3M6TP26_POCDA|nr:hypothetical protein pdam_00006842 [Pocillopora damicornis]
MVLKDSAQEHDKDVHGFTQSKFLAVKEGLEREVDVEPAKPIFPGGKQVKHVVSGGVAGALSRTCVSPLERVKILLQIQVKDPKFSGVGATLIKIGREEGLKGYFKGNGTNVLRIIPYSAVQFASYEEFKKLLKVSEDLQNQTPLRRLVAGGLAGTTSVIATYPLDLVRTRLAAQCEGAERRYRNILHAFQTILKDEGGLISDFVLGHLIVRARGAELKRMDKDRELPVVVRLICGGLAGGISQTVTYPLDVVRRRMQMKGISGDLFAYTSTKHAFTTIVQVEGVKGLYKGMWPNLLKVAPLVGIQFVTYEITKAFLYGQGLQLPWR